MALFSLLGRWFGIVFGHTEMSLCIHVHVDCRYPHLVCEEFVAAGARVLPPGLALAGRGRREEAAPRYPGKRQGDEGPHPSILQAVQWIYCTI